MNLILENVSDDFVKIIKAIAKVKSVKVKTEKEEKLTINGYTYPPLKMSF
ncbi:hypothetical protein [Campylobacter sp. VTCC 70190]